MQQTNKAKSETLLVQNNIKLGYICIKEGCAFEISVPSVSWSTLIYKILRTE